MASKILIISPREDGSGRISLTYKAEGASGISRISCDVSPADLLQLVLFCEGCDLRRIYGEPQMAEVELDGLTVTYAPSGDEIHLLRQIGYSEKAARIACKTFLTEMAGVVEAVLDQAETSKHGITLKTLLKHADLPASYAAEFTADETAAVLHRLHEMALLILNDRAMEKGSRFAKLLRAKKSRPEAEACAAELVASLADSLLTRAS